MNMIPVGDHLLADLSGIRPSLLCDPERLLPTLRAALRDNHFHILQEVVHRFEQPGGGFTSVMLLSESHAALHTYPENEYLAVDIFSCGNARSQPVLDALVELLQPSHVNTTVTPRQLRRATSEADTII
ncbi:MAG: adenosylmethionine decarboxylase [Planctomycetales bacterium]